MSLSRNNLILLGVLVVQIIIGVVLLVLPQGGNAEAQGGPLLAEFDTAAVTELTLTDNTGASIVIAQEEGAWVLPEADNYPVDATKVNDLLGKIDGLTADRLIAESSSSHRRLEVSGDAYQRLIEIAQGDETEALYIGTASGTNATHMRRGGDDRVYLTSGLASWEANVQPTAWVNPVYFQIDQNTIVSVTLRNINGTFEFEKTGDTWTLVGLEDGETFDASAMTGFLGQMATVRLQRPLGTEAEDTYGMDSPLATVTIRTQETMSSGEEGAEPNLLEATYTLRVGARLEDENAYVFESSESDYFVTVAAFTAENFTSKTRDDFLVIEEAPATEDAG